MVNIFVSSEKGRHTLAIVGKGKRFVCLNCSFYHKKRQTKQLNSTNDREKRGKERERKLMNSTKFILRAV